jgi:hypothetical protein
MTVCTQQFTLAQFYPNFVPRVMCSIGNRKKFVPITVMEVKCYERSRPSASFTPTSEIFDGKHFHAYASNLGIASIATRTADGLANASAPDTADARLLFLDCLGKALKTPCVMAPERGAIQAISATGKIAGNPVDDDIVPKR